VGGWDGGCAGVFIEKKATAASIQATNITAKPTSIIVKIAPTSRSNPAVLNIFSPDFTDRISNDFF